VQTLKLRTTRAFIWSKPTGVQLLCHEQGKSSFLLLIKHRTINTHGEVEVLPQNSSISVPGGVE